MANLTTTVRDQNGRELFRMNGRIPASQIKEAAVGHAEMQAKALQHRDAWQVTTQRGSVPAKSYEDLSDGLG